MLLGAKAEAASKQDGYEALPTRSMRTFSFGPYKKKTSAVCELDLRILKILKQDTYCIAYLRYLGDE